MVICTDAALLLVTLFIIYIANTSTSGLGG